ELLGPDGWRLLGLAALLADVLQEDALGRLLATLGLRTGETRVAARDLAEPALTPRQLTGAAFLDALDGVVLVLEALGARAVALDDAGELAHGVHHRWVRL